MIISGFGVCSLGFIVKRLWQPCILLVDDQDTIDDFKEKAASGHVDVTDYGQGWGKDPPNDIKEWIENYET